MRYLIEANSDDWPKSHTPLSYGVVAECYGRLIIDFSFCGKNRKYENRFTNIPLFLNELEIFLSRVSSNAPQVWNLGFAPFANGIINDGWLLISSKAGEDFSDGIYDAMSCNDLKIFRKRLRSDVSKYGSIQMALSQDGNIVGDF
jgi:hypothetical protein